MLFKIRLSVNHWWQTKILKKKPVSARIFIKEKFLGHWSTRILIKKWAEVESLYTRVASWKWFTLTNCSTEQVLYGKIYSGWRSISYEKE